MVRSALNESATSGGGVTPAQAAAITANSAKEGITADQKSAIQLNSAKVGITATEKANIVSNTSAVTDHASRISHLITFPSFIHLTILVSNLHANLSNGNAYPIAKISSSFKAGSNNGISVYEVQWRGHLINNGAAANIPHGSILFKLPGGYRPAETIRRTINKGGSFTTCALEIRADGNVQFLDSSGGFTHLFFDDIRYYTA